MNLITLEITDGPTICVPWFLNINALQVMESAYYFRSDSNFSFSLEYYGTLGYLVAMIDGIYETTEPTVFYWEFFVNGKRSKTGIDNTILKPGDKVTFTYEEYSEEKHGCSTVAVKHAFKTRAKSETKTVNP